jgi:hypothetical protein
MIRDLMADKARGRWSGHVSQQFDHELGSLAGLPNAALGQHATAFALSTNNL